MSNLFVLSWALLFAALCVFIFHRARAGMRLSRQVLCGLAAGAVLGLALQWGLGVDHPQLPALLAWVSIVGDGYVSLLKVVMMPLVAVSILAAIAKLEQAQALGKIGAAVMACLLGLVMLAGLVGVAVTRGLGLSAQGLLLHDSTAAAQQLQHSAAQVQTLSLPQLLLSLIPTNIVSDLAGGRSLAVIGVVIFAVLAGVALLQLRQEQPQTAVLIARGIDALQCWVMRMVRLVIALTPYGVMALIVKVVAHYRWQDILSLFGFIAVCYAAMLLMFGVHCLLLLLIGKNPAAYLRQAWPVLTFAFVSRSSAASIPLSVASQQRMGVPDSVANFAASFGANMGQNGCAGVYPAMMVAMIAPMLGVDPLAPSFLLTLLPAIALGSIGVAGVGGGGTFAALIVLSALNFPIALVGVLMAIEPLVDMGRTALNVNGSMLAGVISSRLLGLDQQATEPTAG